MTHATAPRRRGPWRLVLFGLALAGVAAAGYALFRPAPEGPPPVAMPPEPEEATPQQVHALCGACHAYPPPETLPRSVWRKEVQQGYDFFRKDAALRLDFPPLESVVRYYERRAPESLPVLRPESSAQAPPVRFERQGWRLPGPAPSPGVAHVTLAHLTDDPRPEVLVCDAGRDQVLRLRPGRSPAWQPLAEGVCAAHAEVVDLDGDGVPDVLLACLGNFYATDDRVGSVVWLRGTKDGRFVPHTLLQGVGRVADVRAADFNGDGRLDLVVAVFGWRETGEVLYLENHTDDWEHPRFEPHVVDRRHGAIHVPVCDLDGDGRPDFVALISQEHETVVAFLNEGGGRFRPETIYTAPHLTFGCSGISLVDLDGDGRLDVLLTNGDALDAPYLLKPYHGVTWLRNGGAYPFEPRRLADVYGACRAFAADVDGDGDLDVVVVSFLPGEFFPQRREHRPDAVVLLEQTGPGRFVRHSLEAESCDYPTCVVGDVDGDGRPDLVLGRFARGDQEGNAVVVWKNLAGR